MKAILLAAGTGTRLQPITLTTPKCLVPVNGVPMMEYWFRLFRRHGINEILINLNHLPVQVEAFVNQNAGDLKVTLVYEHELLGSLGTLIANRDFFSHGEDLFILYADNLTNVDLSRMLHFHRAGGRCFTMGLFRTNNPSGCGIATLDMDQTITAFTEKPEHPASDLANAGIYITNNLVFNYLPDNLPPKPDIGFHLLPRLQGVMKGYYIPDFLIDIGTIQNLNLAHEIIANNPDLFQS